MNRIASVAAFVAALALAGFTVSQAAQHTTAQTVNAECSTQCANGCTTCSTQCANGCSTCSAQCANGCTTGCNSCPAAGGASNR